MRILLVEEYSSFHRYLKEGLESLGQEVTLASSGDGWKKIGGSDIEWPASARFGLHRLRDANNVVKKMRDFDVVQFVNPTVFGPIESLYFNRKIISSNTLCSLACVGDDAALLRVYKKKGFEYYIDDFEKESLRGKGLKGIFYKCSDDYTVKMADILIPGLYEYSIGYQDNRKLYPVIPMPVNTDVIKYSENVVSDKVVFFHGLNRENAKGTKYIRQALEMIKKKYGNQVEIIIDGRMPFDKYLEVINKTNVVVDQCCAYGYGINALVSMAKGKIVMAGAHDKTLEGFGIKREDCPVFCATPNVDQLVKQMSHIVEHKDKILQWGYDSRKYVEELHNYKKVAQQYIDAWKGTGKI